MAFIEEEWPRFLPKKSQKQNIRVPRANKAADEGSGTEETGEREIPKSSIRQFAEEEAVPVPSDPKILKPIILSSFGTETDKLSKLTAAQELLLATETEPRKLADAKLSKL